MKKSVLFISIILLAGCAGKPTPIPDAGSQSARLYKAECTTCHSLPHPKRNTYEQWVHLIGVMENQIKHKQMAPLGADEKSSILDYLKKHSR